MYLYCTVTHQFRIQYWTLPRTKNIYLKIRCLEIIHFISTDRIIEMVEILW